MVKKLLKQEMLYYIRSLLPVWVILMSIAILGRGIHFFESDTWVYSVIGNSSLAAYGLSISAAVGLTTLFVVIRYYRNMFTGEGYLTLTLPVSVSQHLRAKLFAAMIVMAGTTAIVVVSVIIFLGGEWIIEICKAIDYLTKDMVAELGIHLACYVVEGLLLMIIVLSLDILVLYMCMSIGQTFQKRRILAAIVIYYGINLAVQVVMMVLNIAITIAIEEADGFSQWLIEHYQGLIHGCLLGGIVFSSVISVIVFGVCCHILGKRLNLE